LDLFLRPFQETDHADLAALDKFEQGASVRGTPMAAASSASRHRSRIRKDDLGKSF
jgi:hypothetical protein